MRARGVRPPRAVCTAGAVLRRDASARLLRPPKGKDKLSAVRQCSGVSNAVRKTLVAAGLDSQLPR